ncbi:hypothetical protein [Flavobacterium sp. W22_SRS_FP1]|uniref:hypothetical protein n=1 Tax=Flavobacterium sp. W22_SRS_FP1 TaxID=3240276 RepID=UPI003F8FC5E8
MKTLKLIAIGIILLVSSSIQAQVSVSLNIGTAPSWGPYGYSQAEYYYLPDVQAYFDIRASQFIFFGNGRWVRSRYLPRQYRNYDLNRGYKVVLNNYHGDRPYTNFDNDRKRYYKGYRDGNQRTIGQNHDHQRYSNDRNTQNRRYSENRKSSNNHSKYDKKRANNRNDDKRRGNNKDNRGHGKH